jgi:hypothetical protein
VYDEDGPVVVADRWARNPDAMAPDEQPVISVRGPDPQGRYLAAATPGNGSDDRMIKTRAELQALQAEWGIERVVGLDVDRLR